MRTKSWLSALAVSLGIGVAIAVQACGDSTTGPTHAQVVAACTHICQCEAGTPDPTCQTDCQGSAGSSSTSLPTSSSVSSFAVSSGALAAADQACVDCFNAAACADIVNGTACTSACQ